MKTKSEILKSHLYTPDTDDMGEIYEAMDEYAQQTAMEVAEWIFDNNFRMILVANDKCYVRSSDDTTLILTKAALFAKFEAERNQQQSELTCPECLSNRILEWPDKYQCRKCEHVWERSGK